MNRFPAVVIFCIAFIAFMAVPPAYCSQDLLLPEYGPEAIMDKEIESLPRILIAAGSDYSDQEYLDEDPDFLKEEAGEEIVRVADPLYYWNKGMFHFNDKLYFWFLKPVATAYSAVIPRMVRTGVKNFFHNLEMPVRFANCILQGKLEAASHEFARFVVNSTEGILGFDDPAKNYPELKNGDEDLGQTFATYGIGNGIYIVWPFLGPSTLRDTFGMAGDRFLKPVSYIQPVEVSLGVTGYRMINETSLKIGDYESFKKSALEPYEGLRNAYVQNRQKKVRE